MPPMTDVASEKRATVPPSPRWFGLAHLVIFGAGIGFFVLSFVALGVLPGLRLQHDMGSFTPADMPTYTDAEQRGRNTYVSLGCGDVFDHV